MLVAGATGYIGGLLARALRERRPRGPLPRARPARGRRDLERLGCEVVRGDVLEPATLARRSTGSAPPTTWCTRWAAARARASPSATRAAADNFAPPRPRRGVERMIYLGGLGEPGSEHLRSRHQTAEVLGRSGVPLTYFRAAAVIGAGSESFRVVYYLVKRLPAMVTPRWVTTRTQPIAIADVIAYLSAAPADRREPPGREIQIGGPEVTTYGGMMEEMARALDRRPPLRLPVPLLTPRLSSLWIGLVTPVDVGVARPLIEGLATETVVTRPLAGWTCSRSSRRRSSAAMRAALDRGRRPGRVRGLASGVELGEGAGPLLLDAAGLVELEAQRVDHRPGQQREADEVEPDQGDEDEAERAADLVDARLAEIDAGRSAFAIAVVRVTKSAPGQTPRQGTWPLGTT